MKIFKLWLLFAAMMMAFAFTACSNSSGSGSEEEELLDGDYNGTGILDGETYWVSFFAKSPCEVPFPQGKRILKTFKITT